MADGKILRSDILDEDVIKGLKDVSKEIEISKNFQSVIIQESQKFKENLGINDMKSFNKMMNENAQNIKKLQTSKCTSKGNRADRFIE